MKASPCCLWLEEAWLEFYAFASLEMERGSPETPLAGAQR